MSGVLLVMAILAPLVLAPLAAGRHGRWMPVLAPLPALAAAAMVPAGTTLEIPWLLMGTHLGLDVIARWFLASGALVWLAAALFAAASIKDGRAGRFRLFFTLAMAGSLGLTLAQDMVVFYAGFALMGLSGYGLVAHHGASRARRAGRLYLAWTIAGEVAIFGGLVFLVAATGTHVMGDVAISPPDTAVALLVLGFGIKLALPGLHVWLPTAYGNAPAAGAAVLSGPMIAAGLLGWLRFLPPGDPGLAGWGEALMAAGLTGAFYGVALGLPQGDPRVVLGYSSIAKMGVLTAGFGAALMNPGAAPALVLALAVYAAHHTVVKAGLFLGIGLLESPRHGRLARGGVVVLALALAGAPLTSGAAAKAWLGLALPAAMAHLQLWLTAAAVASVLLIGRFVFLAFATGHQRHGGQGPWAPAAFAALVLTALLAPPLVAAPALLLGGGMPLLAGGVIVLAAVLLWPRHRPIPFAWIPPGDVLHPVRHGWAVMRRRWRPAAAPAEAKTPPRRVLSAADKTSGPHPLLSPWHGVAWLAVGGLIYLAITQGGLP